MEVQDRDRSADSGMVIGIQVINKSEVKLFTIS